MQILLNLSFSRVPKGALCGDLLQLYLLYFSKIFLSKYTNCNSKDSICLFSNQKNWSSLPELSKNGKSGNKLNFGSPGVAIVLHSCFTNYDTDAQLR